MSSHQLQYIKKSPHIAILLNIFQEHLDHYTSYNAYQQAKWNITRFQNEDDYFIYNFDQPLLKGFLSSSEIKRQFYPYSLKNKVEQGCYVDNNKIFFNGEFVYDCSGERYLKGEHNIMNMMAAIEVCKILNISNEIIQDGLSDFKGLPHRMEHIGTYRGINFYNDSISTIPEATIAALKALQHVQTLILGGYDRGIDYSVLIDYMIQNPVENIIFVGEAGRRMRNLWIHEIVSNPQIQNDFVNFFDAENYENVVKLAYQITDEGQICLLSPAASSYDSFKNFEHRGNYFRELIELYK